jgi:hypothetical protein
VNPNHPGGADGAGLVLTPVQRWLVRRAAEDGLMRTAVRGKEPRAAAAGLVLLGLADWDGAGFIRLTVSPARAATLGRA